MQINRCFNCMEDMSDGKPFCRHCGKRRTDIKQLEYALPIGSILYGKYLIGVVIGQGGFGITYIGYDIKLGIKVAIKEYFPLSMANRSTIGDVLWNVNAIPKEQGCESFLKEARKMAKLMNIPEVVRVLEIILENNTAYIVMDFVEGVTLKKKMTNSGAMSSSDAIATLIPIIRALAKAHRLGIIHRDISPDNIMIDRYGSMKLLDLGAAKEIDIRSEYNKQSTMMVHKDSFSPPEQYSTSGNIGPWTDVYAMCATIYYCTTGRLAPMATDRIFSKTAIGFPAGYSPRLKAVLEKGMSLEPKDRYQSMDELLKRLMEQQQGRAAESTHPRASEMPQGRAAERQQNSSPKPTPQESLNAGNCLGIDMFDSQIRFAVMNSNGKICALEEFPAPWKQITLKDEKEEKQVLSQLRILMGKESVNAHSSIVFMLIPSGFTLPVRKKAAMLAHEAGIEKVRLVTPTEAASLGITTDFEAEAKFLLFYVSSHHIELGIATTGDGVDEMLGVLDCFSSAGWQSTDKAVLEKRLRSEIKQILKDVGVKIDDLGGIYITGQKNPVIGQLIREITGKNAEYTEYAEVLGGANYSRKLDGASDLKDLLFLQLLPTTISLALGENGEFSTGIMRNMTIPAKHATDLLVSTEKTLFVYEGNYQNRNFDTVIRTFDLSAAAEGHEITCTLTVNSWDDIDISVTNDKNEVLIGEMKL